MGCRSCGGSGRPSSKQQPSSYRVHTYGGETLGPYLTLEEARTALSEAGGGVIKPVYAAS